MLEFPTEEYIRRHEHLQKEMQKCGVDVVMFTTPYNIRYFCGFQSVVWVSKIATPGTLIVKSDGQKRLIGSRSAYETMKYTSCLSENELLYYGKSTPDNARPASHTDALIQTLTEFGAKSGRLGMELGTTMRLHINQDTYQAVMNGIQDTTMVDFTSNIWSIRSVKSKNEIAALKKCAMISKLAYQKALSCIKLGETTEKSLNAVYCAEAYRQGAERQEPMIVCFGQGRYNAGNCPPSDKIITDTKGEILLFDGGPIFKGYYSDTIRMAVVGGLSPRQEDFYKMAKETLYYTLENIKPGVSVSQLMEMQDRFVEKSGYADNNLTKGWSGHGIGLEIHEPPTISSDCDIILQEGNTLAIEPTIGDDILGHFTHEENIVVTKTGYELISDFLPDITIL